MEAMAEEDMTCLLEQSYWKQASTEGENPKNHSGNNPVFESLLIILASIAIYLGKEHMTVALSDTQGVP